MNRLLKFTALLSLSLFVILGSAISNGFCGSWFDKYRMSAEKGKAEDQFLLGQIYFFGTDVSIPDESGHRFRRKPATDSDRFRPPIPGESGHPVLNHHGADSDAG